MGTGRLYNEQFPCDCVLCRLIDEFEAWNHTTMDSVTFLQIHGSRCEGQGQQGARNEDHRDINVPEYMSADSDTGSDDTAHNATGQADGNA